MVHCHKCGAKAAEDDTFCPECGARMLKEEQKKEKPPAPKPAEKEEPEAPRPKERPVPQPQRVIERVVVQQKESSATKLILTIIIILLVIFLARACVGGRPKPPLPYLPEPVAPPTPPPTYEPEPAKVTCETFTDDSGCKITKCTDGSYDEICPEKPKPEPTPPQIDKAKECSGVAMKINDACYSCGLISCGLIVEIENTGSKPIYRFLTEAYNDPKNFDDSGVWEPLDVGATNTVAPYASDYARLVKFIPVVLVGDEEVVCDSKSASYGNAYGEGFGEC